VHEEEMHEQSVTDTRSVLINAKAGPGPRERFGPDTTWS